MTSENDKNESMKDETEKGQKAFRVRNALTLSLEVVVRSELAAVHKRPPYVPPDTPTLTLTMCTILLVFHHPLASRAGPHGLSSKERTRAVVRE